MELSQAEDQKKKEGGEDSLKIDPALEPSVPLR